MLKSLYWIYCRILWNSVKRWNSPYLDILFSLIFGTSRCNSKTQIKWLYYHTDKEKQISLVLPWYLPVLHLRLLIKTSNSTIQLLRLTVLRDGPLFFWRGDEKYGKNCLQGLKRQNKVFANTICVWKMFAGKSDKPSKILVSKLIQIITESNKLTQGHKNMELGTSKFSFYNIEINDKVKNSWFFVPIYSQHYLLTFCPIKLHRVFSKLYETK